VLDESHHPERITTKSDADNVCIHGLLQQRCRRLDIISVCSRPHEHEHNGLSEKTFHDIGDLAHTMLKERSKERKKFDPGMGGLWQTTPR
jgi:hypothetical protein